VNPTNPGKTINFLASPAVKKYPDFFAPFRAFGFDLSSEFNGTLFRLPLRSVEQAARSRLSSSPQTGADLEGFLREFAELIPSCLLFLKSLIRIELSVWNEGNDKEDVFFTSSCKLTEESRKMRDAIPSLLAQVASGSIPPYPYQETDVDVVIESVTTLNGAQTSVAQRYLVCSNLGGSNATSTALNPASSALRFVPFASVACALNTFDSSDSFEPIKGRAFCFLPLPTHTGLPVHVNGAFELSSNRRDVWFGDDMAGEGLLRAQWNKVLLEDVAVPAYLRLLELASAHLSPAHQMQLWPVKSSGGPWDWISAGVFAGSVDRNVLYSPGSKAWIPPRNVIFLDSPAFFGDAVVRETVLRILCDMNTNVVNQHSSMMECFKAVAGFVPLCSEPILLINLLQKHKPSLSYADATCLLPFLFQATSSTSFDFSSLISLRILPVFGDAVVAVPCKGDPKPCVLVSEHVMPIVARSDLLHAVVGWERAGVKDVFVSDALQAVCEVRPLMPCDLPLVLRGVLGEKCRNQGEVRWEGLVDRAWLEGFWDKVLKQGAEWVSACAEWPIFPVTSTMGLLLCRSEAKSSRILNQVPQVDANVLEALMLLGVRFADSSLIHASFEAWSPFFCDSSSGILAAMVHCFDSIQAMNQRVRSLVSSIPASLVAFRSLMLGQKLVILSNGDVLSPLDLPIHQTATSQLCALDPAFNVLPPSKVPVSLLSKCFVVVSSDAEAAAYGILGLKSITRAAWYRQHFLPSLSGFVAADRDEAVLEMLERLAELCREDATYEEHLRGCAFLSSGSQELKLVTDLYDPAQSELAGLVDAEKEYPGAAFRREDVLGVLRRLGLRRSLDKDAVLRAAETISKSEGPSRKPSGAKLFAYLDSQLPLVSALLSDQDVCDCLRMIDWIPVDDAPPLSWLPVSTRNKALGVAAPVVVRPVQDACLVSFSHALCSVTARSESLRRLLQWDIPPPSRLVAAQLMKLADVVNKLPSEANVTYSDVLGQYRFILAHLDQARQQSTNSLLPGWQEAKSPEGKTYYVNPAQAKTQWERPTAQGCGEFTSVIAVLNDLEQPLVLISKTHAGIKHPLFVPPRFVAFNPVFESPPFLNRFPSDLEAYSEVFKALNVKQGFIIEDLLKSLSVAAAEYGSSPIPAETRPSVVRTILSLFPEVSALLEGADVMKSIQPPEEQQESHLALKQKIASLELKFDLAPPSRVFVLDESGHLIPANALNVDDAPWLSASLRQSASARFVHGDVVPNVAIALGCTSLRTALIGGSVALKSLPCNGHSQTEDILANRSAGDNGMLLELMEAADVLGARSMHVMLDCRPHPNIRLLDPRCSGCQGPALVLFFPNTVLTVEHICRMLGRNEGDQPLFALSSSDLISRYLLCSSLYSDV
jgi:sacsin